MMNRLTLEQKRKKTYLINVHEIQHENIAIP